MRRALILSALLLGAVGCGPSKPRATGGRGTFEALNCRSCHRVGDDGARSAPDLTYVGFRKSKAWLDLWLKDPQAWRPGTLMPNPHLSDPARASLVDYLSTLKGQDFGANKPWDAPEVKNDPLERGRVLFAKAGCIACHGKAGRGGYPNNNVPGGQIPALTKVFETYTRAELVKKITKGSVPAKADPAGAEPLIRMPPWGEVLSQDEVSAVADYVISLGKAGAADAGKSDW